MNVQVTDQELAQLDKDDKSDESSSSTEGDTSHLEESKLEQSKQKHLMWFSSFGDREPEQSNRFDSESEEEEKGKRKKSVWLNLKEIHEEEEDVPKFAPPDTPKKRGSSHNKPLSSRSKDSDWIRLNSPAKRPSARSDLSCDSLDMPKPEEEKDRSLFMIDSLNKLEEEDIENGRK